jgi:hypothetical protein
VLVIPLRALHTLWRSLFSLPGHSFHHVHQFSSAKSWASPWIISSEHNVTDSLIPSTKLKRTRRSQSRPQNWVCHIAMHVMILSHVLINTWEKRQGACNVKCRVELSSKCLGVLWAKPSLRALPRKNLISDPSQKNGQANCTRFPPEVRRQVWFTLYNLPPNQHYWPDHAFVPLQLSHLYASPLPARKATFSSMCTSELASRTKFVSLRKTSR